MIKWLLISLCLLSTLGLQAQELEANVNISAPQVTTVDPKVFKSLESDIEDLYRSTSWTSTRYENHERIRTDFQINIVTDDSRNTYEANFQIQVTRPVYGSTYSTVLFTFIDKGVKFTYEPFQPLQKSTTNFVNGLSSLLSFYAYMIIGMDYDSFVNMGGSEYYASAEEIANTVPSQTADAMNGWTVTDRKNEGRTRYWLLENVTNSRMAPFREAIYLYHRKGLDLMADSPLQARSNILEALKKIQISNEKYFNSLLVQLFCNSKKDEIIEIFKPAKREERQEVYTIMKELDKSNASDYNVLNS